MAKGAPAVVDGIQRVRISEQVSQRLCDDIVNGRLRPGDALPSERALARTFTVSVPAIREGIRILSAKGLVSVRHGVGTFVNSYDHWNSAEPLSLLMRREESTLLCVHEVRATLETEIAELAALRATEECLMAVAGALERMAASLHTPEIHCAADLDFHLALARATGNSMFAVVLQPITTLILRGIERGSALPAAMERGVREHRVIFASVQGRDSRGARRAMAAHMETSYEELVASEAVASSIRSGQVLPSGLRYVSPGEASEPLVRPPSSTSVLVQPERRPVASRQKAV